MKSKEVLAQSMISFGPSCIAAEILKACRMREKTYGFDWFRSGSIHHKLFFKLDTESFVSNIVMRPSIFFSQGEKLANTKNRTVELKQKKIIYGYDILYNPHRDYNKETENYFRRAFKRINLRMKCSEEIPRPILLMADYTNKEDYTYFKCPFVSARYLMYSALLRYGYLPKIVIIRFVLVAEDKWVKDNIQIEERNNVKVYKIPISHEVDKCEKQRRIFYSSVSEYLINS